MANLVTLQAYAEKCANKLGVTDKVTLRWHTKTYPMGMDDLERTIDKGWEWKLVHHKENCFGHDKSDEEEEDEDADEEDEE